MIGLANSKQIFGSGFMPKLNGADFLRQCRKYAPALVIAAMVILIFVMLRS